MNKRQMLMLGGAATVAVAAGGYYLTTSQTPEMPAPVAGGVDVALNEYDFVLGADSAPITVVEYASLTCPHCARFHAVTWPRLKTDYVDTGKVRFVMREVYFDQFGLLASVVARCGDAEEYHWLIDKFLTDQQVWTRAQDIIAEVRKIGITAGLTSERLDVCMRDDAMAKALVENYQANVTADGVDSTPTFFINGQKHTGDMSFEAFAALIDPLVEG